ncbi:pyridoxal 5'-phosphate synthase glutaminase subunit PdxT [Mycobacterium sp. KBS0706]|uniref:pyridoxal 5'-phosphate synthase glutaminase subunit PdxT n=1 Tax=Mycobacterium sp. KBS0706 TaxID=2578109 RepID=UPI00110F76F3|nr:pyridoxal 5'-phosphate synthase glutaminase subunit PdxT [Mycobacterium sp. KBS0706]TSD87115.1 pyridoxal 5'-phosphate synthase glutaminase subunit PdxT [Mycobacterium sp. KBS0706]
MVSGQGGVADAPRIGVLALQGDFEAHASALGEAGAEAVPVRLPAHLAGLAGLVIPGGESSALLKLAAHDGLFEALQSFARAMPVFGTCAGCIMLARRVLRPEQESLGVLDATVERNAYGRQVDSAILETPTALPGGPLETVYIRAPRIAEIGPGVEVLAERGGHPVLVRQGRLLAATFHPELSTDRRVHRLFLEIAAGAGNGAERAA